MKSYAQVAADAGRMVSSMLSAYLDVLAENQRLAAELDRYQGRTVIHTTLAHMDEAALASIDMPDGTILRATDSGKELLLHGGTWAER